MAPINLPPLKGIIIEDDPDAAAFIANLLRPPSVPAFDLEIVGRLSDALARLEPGGFDFILLDLFLPDSQGLATVGKVMAKVPKTAVVVMADFQTGPLAVLAIQEGAQDYLVKGHMDRGMLMRSIRNAVERKTIIQRKDESLQNLSHELRNPLAALVGSMRALSEAGRGSGIPASMNSLIEIASRSTNHLWAMIEDLLDVTRVETGRLPVVPEFLSLRELIGQSVKGCAGLALEKGIAMAADLAPGLPPVLADPVRVRQILINLVSNSLKFTPEGGSIRVEARVLADDPAFVRVDVRDTGCGVSEEEKERLFQRLYQTESGGGDHHKGLGLGLFICKELVMRQGGRIWVESVQGTGSVFSFTLPVFSLEGNLRRVLGGSPSGVRGLALVAVDVLSGSAGLKPLAREHALHALAGLLKPAGPALDLVLPRPEEDRAVYPLLLVVRADREQARVVAGRILNKTASSPVLKELGVVPNVSYAWVDLAGPFKTPADLCAAAAVRLGEVIEPWVREWRSGKLGVELVEKAEPLP
ncbi:MAG: hybrid sensor histidine kinase/response regulator [Elusimicrobiota bacterium]|jgi:signal transduction histidine kinase